MKLKLSFKAHATINVVFSFFAFYFGAFMLNDGINLIMPYVEAAYGWPRGDITAAATSAGLISIVVSFLVVTCVMKIGVKKSLGVLVIISGIASIVMGYSLDFGIFAVTFGILQIVAAAGLFVLPGFLLANWYRKYRGTMMGIATVGAPVSGATCSLLMNQLIGSMGFDTAFLLFGVAIIILGIVCLLFVVDKPEDVGYAPDNEEISPEELVNIAAEFERSAKELPIKKMVFLKESWLYIVAFGIFSLITTGVMSQMVPRLMDTGFDPTTAVSLFSLGALIGIPLSFFWGWLDDRISTRVTCSIFAIVCAIGAVCILNAGAHNMPITIAGMVAVGSLQGGLPNLETSFIAFIFGRKNFANANRVLRTGTAVFRSLGYSAMGVIYTVTGTYDMSYIMFAVLAVVSAVLIVLTVGCYDRESERFNRADKLVTR